MVRQYRIDRFNGMEILVCEVYRKHTWSQQEYDSFQACREANRPDDVDQALFREMLDEWCHEEVHEKDDFFGLKYPIPVYDPFPAVILRGPLVDNRLASLQVEYVNSVLPVEVCDEVRRFYDFLDSRHWRDTISHQLEQYGSLFGSVDD